MEWNKEDLFLYLYFNKTFWEKIEDQDENFWEDVNKLKQMVANVEKECIEPEEKVKSVEKYGNILLCRNLIILWVLAMDVFVDAPADFVVP